MTLCAVLNPSRSIAEVFTSLRALALASVLLAAAAAGTAELALFALAFYAALMPIAYVAAGVGLGDWSLRRWRPDNAARLPARIAASAAALLVLTLLGWLPMLGGVVGFVALTAGLGALLLQGWPWVSAASA